AATLGSRAGLGRPRRAARGKRPARRRGHARARDLRLRRRLTRARRIGLAQARAHLLRPPPCRLPPGTPHQARPTRHAPPWVGSQVHPPPETSVPPRARRIRRNSVPICPRLREQAPFTASLDPGGPTRALRVELPDEPEPFERKRRIDPADRARVR